MTRLSLIVLFIVTTLKLQAQLAPYLKYEPVSEKDFCQKGAFTDTLSHAVILHNIGSTDFEVKENGDFTMVFKLHKRILIRNSSAYDLGSFSIQLFSGNNDISEEKIENLEASTFNLVNGKIEEYKIDKSSMFKTKFNKQTNILKYALTNIKVGSIIEYGYTIKSPFFYHLRSWTFQSKYPCLWSEYQVMIPPMLSYFTIKKGQTHYTFDSGWQGKKILTQMETFNSTIKYSMDGPSKYAIWLMKDIPAFQQQQYISADENFINRIEFNLQSVNFRNGVVKTMLNWPNTAFELLQKESLWGDLGSSNSWLHNIKKQIPDSFDILSKAKKIYEFVRDNYNCTDYNDIYLSKNLKETYTSKTGNVADINILLTAILIKMGYDAHPVILSTRDNGLPNATYAILGQYNYVLSRIKINNDFYLLDASDKKLGFGRINKNCYNNVGRVIDKIPLLLNLSPDSISERKTTVVSLQNDKGIITGNIKIYEGYFGSKDLRDQQEKNKLDEYKRKLIQYSSEIKIENFSVDSLSNYEEPLVINYDIKISPENVDHIYLNPMLAGILKTNPFPSTTRLYPVELNYLQNNTYTLSMEIPEGYQVEEIPKSASVKLNGKDASYDYLISNDGDKIQFRSVLKINKTNFSVEEYQNLRDFYAYIIKKQEEMIVLKKK